MAEITVPNSIKINPCLLLGESLFRTGFDRLKVVEQLRDLAREQHSAEMDWGMEQEFTDEQAEAWTKRLEVWAKIGEDCAKLVEYFTHNPDYKHITVMLDVLDDLRSEIESAG